MEYLSVHYSSDSYHPNQFNILNYSCPHQEKKSMQNIERTTSYTGRTTKIQNLKNQQKNKLKQLLNTVALNFN